MFDSLQKNKNTKSSFGSHVTGFHGFDIIWYIFTVLWALYFGFAVEEHDHEEHDH